MASVIVKIEWSALWFVATGKRVPFRYSSNVIAQTTAKHSLWVVASSGSLPVSMRDKYPTGRILPSSCSSSSTQPIYLSQTSVSSVNFPSFLGRASTGGLTRAFFNDAIMAYSLSFNGQKFLDWSLRNCLLVGAAICAKSGTKRRRTLQRPMNEQSPVWFVGFSSFARHPVVCSYVRGILDGLNNRDSQWSRRKTSTSLVSG